MIGLNYLFFVSVLRSAGHGDEIAIVDCNFPAAECAMKTVSGEHIQLAGVDMVEALDAICSVYPLDFFVDCSVHYMAPSPGDDLPPLGKEVHDKGTAMIHSHADGVAVNPIERMKFYDRARASFAIVQASGERRPYGNFILTKGVVGPDGNDLKP
jgi:L-fucose mutarotase